MSTAYKSSLQYSTQNTAPVITDPVQWLPCPVTDPDVIGMLGGR